MEVGFACIDITPEVGSVIPGGFHPRFATGIHDPLLVNAAVFSNGNVKLAIVSLDALSIKSSIVAYARRMAEESTGIPQAHILIAATHTHNGGPIADAFLCEADKGYCDNVAKAIAQAISKADRNKCRALIATGFGYEDTVAFNRRCVMKDGTQRTHPGKLAKDAIAIAGPIDPRVGVLAAMATDGTLLGCIVNYACHATVMWGDEFSADYIHYVRETIKAVMGEQTHVVYLNGACGDVTQVAQLIPREPEVGEKWARRVGGRIGAEALKVIFAMDFDAYSDEVLPLAAVSKILSLPTRKVPQQMLEEAMRLLEEGESWDTERIYARELILLNEANKLEPMVNAEVMAMLIGDLAIVSFPCEYFCQFGLDVRSASPYASTFVVSCANGMVGYVPTEGAFRAGGYETRLARSSKLMPDAGILMREAAIELLMALPKAAVRRAATLPNESYWDAGSSPPCSSGLVF
ncbi:MAG: hypothetical protein RMK18_07655 [Armatimonadota bacterium]|nr:hypothetical protein [Armatimonadota bacterium]MCX7776667.1 hypothetical protein [Armatimonadota bacterium]MDW8025718.1 hypothetical protein [Armatimonadota bacterium]